MINKFSEEIQKEIEGILNKIQVWNALFNIKLEFYYDGWAVFLKEKNLYPRCIVIFKSNESEQYSIKSYNVYLQNYKKEKYQEIYSIENINNQDDVLKELRDIIYGKDLGNQALKIYNDAFTE
ncbi:MAG: hypothetical protein KGD58_12995 [Candidatus Lokiarchaeota archaeon]|nr:hypothetical protein [Candidatus Lokiarchaeota archaeon]